MSETKTTYLELDNVYLDFEADGNSVILNGVWLLKDGKELDITDFLTKEDMEGAQQRAIDIYEGQCQSAADHAEAMAEARAEAAYERRQELRQFAKEVQQYELEQRRTHRSLLRDGELKA